MYLSLHRAAGLSIPSIIRPTNVTTVEASRARLRGKVSTAIAARVAAVIRSYHLIANGGRSSYLGQQHQPPARVPALF
jgi:hypothetical protein